VRLSFQADVDLPERLSDDFSKVLSYEVFVETARTMVTEGHFNLLETLVDELANRLFDDPRMITLEVRGEKLDVFDDAECASVRVRLRRN
jgi:dihydroneopterin aldolase